MASRCIQGNAQQWFILTCQGEMPLRTDLRVIFHPHVRIFAETVSRNLTTHARQQFTNHRIVHTHHGTTIKRQIVQEINKRLL
ncbi:hypothetical protein D3C72_994280 [compost metagenome]